MCPTISVEDTVAKIIVTFIIITKSNDHLPNENSSSYIIAEMVGGSSNHQKSSHLTAKPIGCGIPSLPFIEGLAFPSQHRHFKHHLHPSRLQRQYLLRIIGANGARLAAWPYTNILSVRNRISQPGTLTDRARWRDNSGLLVLRPEPSVWYLR